MVFINLLTYQYVAETSPAINFTESLRALFPSTRYVTKKKRIITHDGPPYLFRA